MTHVDDFVDDYESDPYARWMLLLFRLPAIHKPLVDKFVNTKLFCTYGAKRYRVTGASRLGDVFLIADFKINYGYDLRVDVDDCSNWNPEP